MPIKGDSLLGNYERLDAAGDNSIDEVARK
jgi:hypothetical protein